MHYSALRLAPVGAAGQCSGVQLFGAARLTPDGAAAFAAFNVQPGKAQQTHEVRPEGERQDGASQLAQTVELSAGRSNSSGMVQDVSAETSRVRQVVSIKSETRLFCPVNTLLDQDKYSAASAALRYAVPASRKPSGAPRFSTFGSSFPLSVKASDTELRQ
jgi:hypothetical protein